MSITAHLRRRGCITFLAIGITSILLIAGLYAAVTTWPSVGAKGADILRGIIGDEAVSKLEMFVFQSQDSLHKLKYQWGLEKPAVPWQVAAQVTGNKNALPVITQTPAVKRTLTLNSNSPISPTPPPGGQTSSPEPHTILSTTPSPEPVFTSTPTVWIPSPATPLGSVEREGIWSPYIQGVSGRTVAYRTFIQPDPERLYAIVAVVAFDLNHTRLNYVLGSIEPYSPDAPKRSGTITPADLAPNLLLVTFNGGFKATHGHFGAMSDGITTLPPKDGLGTVAIYKDGTVRMGAWGTDIISSTEMTAWRENGPLVVQDGKIDPKIYNNSPADWGYTVNDVSPTWRSGLGISADSQTLYYFAGPSLSMPALANTMLAAGAYRGIQLDINSYWVHFVVIKPVGTKLIPEPLFPSTMNENVDRYLHPYTRDFFYITAVTEH